jgi:hypothetical protein
MRHTRMARPIREPTSRALTMSLSPMAAVDGFARASFRVNGQKSIVPIRVGHGWESGVAVAFIVMACLPGSE